MSIANVGSAAFRARFMPRSAPAADGGASVGFTNPLAIDEEAKAINFAAKTLLGDYQRDLPLSDPTRQAYENWFNTIWTPFYAKLFSFVQGLPPVMLTGTDERMAAVQTRRAELQDFAAKYTAATQKPPSAPVPVDPRTQPPPPKPQGTSGLPTWWPSILTPPQISVPWWVWVGGTVAVIGGGYLAYRSWRNQRAMQERFISTLPGLFPETAPVVSAYQTAAPVSHDVSSCGCPSCGGH